MCNLYSMTKGQQAIRALFAVANDVTGNLPSMPGIFPDYPAPIVRNAAGPRIGSRCGPEPKRAVHRID